MSGLELSSDCKLILLILLVVIVGVLLYNNGNLGNNEAFQANANDEREKQTVTSFTDIVDTEKFEIPDTNSINSGTTVSSRSSESLQQMIPSEGKSSKDSYISSSYNNGQRGNNPNSSSLDKFFSGVYPDNPNDNSGFSGVVDGGDNYAGYTSTDKKLSTEDKFNPAQLLPKEAGGDWFDDPYPTTSVKSAHLLNIYRPTGVNTVSQTLKGRVHDLRGVPCNPHYPVSPWNNSSWQCDNNIKTGALC